MRHVYVTRIALVTTVLLVLACLAFAAIQNCPAHPAPVPTAG